MISKNLFQVFIIFIIFFVTLLIGFLFGMSYVYKCETILGENNTYFSHGAHNKISKILYLIDQYYVEDIDIDQLIDNTLDSIFLELDPHSNYLPKDELELLSNRLNRNYEGIGIEFNIFRDTIFVIKPLANGPSIKAGILAGDKIIKVNDENVAGVGIDNQGVRDRLLGEENTKVKVTILRKNKQIKFEFSRAVVKNRTVDFAYMITPTTGYIKIGSFFPSVSELFKKELLKLKSEDRFENLVLDLTGNGGGYLQEAVAIVDELLEDNKMIVYTKGKASNANSEYKSNKKGVFEKGRLIILVDEGSASASEIVAGAIQDHDRGDIMGRRTFGKGLVQNQFDLQDGSQLRLTTSKYYTPSGRNIQKPFTRGDRESYHSDMIQRLHSGELYDEDSITQEKSLVFKTASGRKVYGGGGIVPDYFVPVDTVGMTTLFNELVSTLTLHEFAFDYAHQNWDFFQKMGCEKFVKEFTISSSVFQSLLHKAAMRNIKVKEQDITQSKEKIKLYLKAFIGRNIWYEKGFYPIIHQDNKMLDKALELLSDNNVIK